MEDPIIILESEREEEIGSIKDQNLGSIKEEIMGEVREEKGNLKFLLASLVKDYQSLQQDHKPITTTQEATKVIKGTSITLEECDDEVLVSLSLGVSSLSKDNNPITMDDEKKNIINSNSNNKNRIEEKRELDDDDDDEGLALGLDVRFDPSPPHQVEATNNNHSQESSLVEDGKEEEPSEMWPPSKVLKTIKVGDKSSGASHQQQQTQLKKARVSIRARCDTQTMNDGCQWRKYGQKIAKGNPCPRAYYRCTVSSSCPVRKQVQRCAEDMSILITTYEGTHNHPLPLSATAMASTTCAAASMLQSPSLISSQQALPNSSEIMAPIFNNNSSSFSSSSCQIISSPNHQFQFQNSSFYSTSNHNSHPTITLDLTTTPPPPSSSSVFSYTPKYSSSTNLNFSSNFSRLQSSMQLPPHYSSPWSNYSGYLTQNRSNQGGVYVINSGSSQQFQGNLHQQQQPIYMNNQNNIVSQHTIAAATKAITTNPKFQSALATALTTYVGNGGVGIGDRLKELNHVADESSSAPLMNLKLSSSSSGGASSSRYLFNMSSSPNHNAQQENGYSSSSIMFPAPFPVSKGSPAVSSNNRSNQFLEQWK